MKRLLFKRLTNPARILARRFYEGTALEPFHPIPNRKPKFMSADESVKIVKSGMPTHLSTYFAGILKIY